jgi:adenylate kinase family enzyme
MYGPPGTGKSTIAEALAASAGVPLVEVTPSDLIISGAEGIERKARAVLQALAMLKDVVVLFDEFDSVLRRRNPGGKIENVFEFLTPGMLPKLKALHESSEKQRVCYLLGTNLVGDLDEAAIRKGRFDEKIGVYPPDLISRTGRLVSQLHRYKAKEAKEPGGRRRSQWPDDWRERAAEVIRLTAGGSMTILGRPGWLTAPPQRKLEEGTPFHYILGKGNRLEPIVPEKNRPKEPEGEGLDAKLEWEEWGWVCMWDKMMNEGEGSWLRLDEALRSASRSGAAR